ncbi:MAG: 3-oxoacyl-ACP reductase FabG [Gammaproteobacteria bacterium]|nr:3-oxoacyl-ACP reductase FabG [Gammaproteobacteria bacterium]
MELKDKVALVTGAGRGIGKAVAIALAQAGAIVVGADINQEMADQINGYLMEQKLPGMGIIMNVTQKDSIQSALSEIKEKYSAPAILVNNAGITRDNLMLRMKDDEWNAVINTNLNSIFNVTQACLRDMVKARWGRIIGITSVVGVTGNAGQANYSAAKAGLIAFSKSLAQEIAVRNITVNTVAPGFIDTQMTQQLTDDQRQMILDHVPMRKIGSPNDIADSVIFLASGKAAYITGQTIHVNGGMFMP